jgi:5-methylcytosine-specific restriction endonuclease McrA
MRKLDRYCRRNHDVLVTGVYANNSCRRCAIESTQKRRVLNSRPPRSEREKETKRVWEKANPGRIQAYTRTSYIRHRNRWLARAKAYLQTPRGREVHREASARYRNSHRDALREQGRLRASHIPKQVTAEVVEYYGPACVYCGGDASGFDHLTPVAKGGETLFENLAPCCWSCNRKKGDRPIWTMLSLEGGEKSSCLVQ